ncbi:hypothetical protein [uncultured Bradyrhizobium sp.]|uniref:hypothetical protein n=1 Tax=uncultured Bradyrhizobium sp. TaxID=199684 RepID=UPI002628A1F1|nr:hypothetical protein [uncultured Bradyrhizobium sp.]
MSRRPNNGPSFSKSPVSAKRASGPNNLKKKGRPARRKKKRTKSAQERKQNLMDHPSLRYLKKSVRREAAERAKK